MRNPPLTRRVRLRGTPSHTGRARSSPDCLGTTEAHCHPVTHSPMRTVAHANWSDKEIPRRAGQPVRYDVGHTAVIRRSKQ